MKKDDLLRLRFLREGMDNEGRLWTFDALEELYSMYTNGYGISKMACYFKRSELAIAQQLHRSKAMDAEIRKRKRYVTSTPPSICDKCKNRGKCDRTKATCPKFR